MAHEPSPIKALVRSKKFQVLIGWTIYLGFVASRSTSQEAVELLKATTWLAAAYLIGQSAVDAVAISCDKNGEK